MPLFSADLLMYIHPPHSPPCISVSFLVRLFPSPKTPVRGKAQEARSGLSRLFPLHLFPFFLSFLSFVEDEFSWSGTLTSPAAGWNRGYLAQAYDGH